MYAALFRIKQYPSGNPYLVTKLLPLSLGCTIVPFARNITGSFTPAAIPIRRTVIENLKSLQFFLAGFIFDANNIYSALITKEGGFIEIQLKIMSKTSKNIMRWVFPSQILPLRINHHVSTVLMWHKSLWSLRGYCLSLHHPPMSLHIWQPVFLNKGTQVILYLNIQVCLSYVWYNLYCLLPWHPTVFQVPFTKYIFNILYLALWWQRPISQR